MSANSTSAYADAPTSGEGPPVLVLHSWFGLTDAIKDRCNDLADAGYCALAPDLFGGRTTDDPAEGERLLLEADPNQLALGVSSCADLLTRMPASSGAPIAVIGYSMGASLGLWLAEREPLLVDRVVAFYGTQSMDFTEARAAYQFHMAAADPMVDPDEMALMEASLAMLDRPIEVFDYEADHFFAEPGTPGHDATAERDAWTRVMEFLDRDGHNA